MIASSRSTPHLKRRWLMLVRLLGGPLLLALVCAAAIVIREPVIQYNLPVAAHVDERVALSVLKRLHFESFNPKFFSYPSLYFYSTALLIDWNSAEQVMRDGRALNLIYAIMTACITYSFATWLSRQPIAGVVAATLTLFSPILISSSSYLSVDMLFVAFSMAALYTFARFYASPNPKLWWLGSALCGLAVASKYNGVLIILCIVIMELIYSKTVAAELGAHSLGRSLSLRWQTGLLIVAAGLLLVLSLLPSRTFLFVLESPNYVNSVIDSADFAFISRLQQQLRGLALIPLGVLALRRMRIDFLSTFVSHRLLLLVVISVGIMLLTTPFAILDWPLFLYDFGLELKKTSAGTGSGFWRFYRDWYVQRESTIVLIVAVPGTAMAFRQQNKGTLLLLVYFAIVMTSLVTSTRGFPRYLSPALPVLAILSSIGLCSLLAQRSSIRWTIMCAALLGLIASAIGGELSPALVETIERPPDHMYRTYKFVVEHLPESKVFYGGFAPISELAEADFSTTELSRTQLASAEILSSQFKNGDLLLVDVRFERLIDDDFRPKLRLRWHDSSEYELFVYQFIP